MKKNSKTNFSFVVKLFMLSVLILFYIFQVTEMTKNLYKIRDYDRKISTIHEESRRAEYGFLKSNSISKAEELVEMNNFVRAENIHYINLLDVEIASR